MKLRVAHILVKGDLTGGPGHSLLSFLKEFPEAQVENYVIYHEPGPLIDQIKPLAKEVCHIQHHTISKYNPLPFLLTVFRTYQFLKKHHIDIAHFQFHTYRDPYLVAVHFSKAYSLLHIRGPAPDIYSSWMSLADHFLFNSEFTRNLADLEKEEQEKSSVIHNAINPELFPPSQKKYNQKNISCVCRIFPKKNIELFLEVAEELKEHTPYSFRIAGEIQDQQYYKHLQHLIIQKGLQGRVQFFQHIENISHFYAETDLLIHPALEEPFGRIILEAFSMKIPVAAFASGAMPEIIQSGTTGILVDPPDTKKMAIEVEKLLKDPERTQRITEEAYQEVFRRFHYSDHAEKIMNLYEKICKE